MTLRHLSIFVTVCESMSMTAAAEKLYMSQPAVSQGIKELEEYYGIKLFERLSRRLYLTEAGKKLLAYGNHILKLSMAAESDMRELVQCGKLRIGASVTIGACLLPKLLVAYKEKWPGTEIEVFEENTEQIEGRLLRDQIDLGVVEGDISGKDIHSESFLPDELILICGRNHPFVKKTEILPEELEPEAFVLREKGSGTRKTFEDTMLIHGLRWRVEWTCNDAETIKRAVSEGLGVSVISRRAAEKEIGEGLLFERQIKDMRFLRQFKLIYHQNKFLTAQMNGFRELWSQQKEIVNSFSQNP